MLNHHEGGREPLGCRLQRQILLLFLLISSGLGVSTVKQADRDLTTLGRV